MKETELWNIERLQPANGQSEVISHKRRNNFAFRNFLPQTDFNRQTIVSKKRVDFVASFFVFTVFVLALNGIFSTSIFAQSDFRVEGAGVEASPSAYVGACPGVIKFNAKIQANGAGRVKYTWIRNDGATAPVEFIDFTEAGVKYVSTTWTLGDARILPNYNGWQQLKVLSPNEYLSNKAEFKLTCSQPGKPNQQAKPDLVIEWAKLSLGKTCRPYNAALSATVKVKNIGTATSPARSDVGLVGAMDATGSGWGNGVGLPALAPGASFVATIPIYYLIDNPAYMNGAHRFEMRVNSGSWIEESNTGNNLYGPVAIEVPASFCASK